MRNRRGQMREGREGGTGVAGGGGWDYNTRPFMERPCGPDGPARLVRRGQRDWLGRRAEACVLRALGAFTGE